MTAATQTTEPVYPTPNMEFVVLTASDGETYVSEKFKTVQSAHGTIMEDFGTNMTPVSCAVSSATVTIHWDGVTDKKVALMLTGHQ